MGKIYLYSQSDGWLDREGIFLFDKPVYKLVYKANVTYLNGKKFYINPLYLIEKLIKRKKLYGIGYISYDFGKEKVIGKFFPQRDDLNLPYIYMLFFKSFKEKKSIDAFPKSRIKNIIFNTPEKKFISMVNKAKEYIESGDIYQVNLSHRIDLEGEFIPEEIFYNLINIQKTPYLMLIRDINFSIISASMELFLRKNKDILKTKPIKGTRKRGKTVEEDKKLAEELLTSDKEIAENLMITDLMRNDLGRLAVKGGVKTTSLFKVEKYETLYQLVSTVEAKIEDTKLKKIVENTFPPGSVTGAPKKRAMEIIAQLEELKRNVYCGSTVFIKPNMDFVMSVAIRQTILKGNKGYIYVGAGITSGSNPNEEYKETLIKAKANIQAIDKNFDFERFTGNR